jgi:uncharacterized membrane protein YfcA
MLFDAVVAIAGVVAGAIASIAGFGIGSVLTPILAYRYGTKLAVAAVSIPHFIATAYRFWLLRKHVDRHTLLSFGVTSAAGGLAGALLGSYATSPMLSIVLGALLVFVAVSEVTGFARRMRFSGPLAWCAGAVSGFLGGLVGNQGGIRSAALLGFAIDKEAFVATATAIGLIVDLARFPVYLMTEGRELLALWLPISIAVVAAVVGTALGKRCLAHVSQTVFRGSVAVLLLLLGAYMLLQGLAPRVAS